MINANHLSVFVMMTCLNGYFDDPALESLAESLLKAERGGAVAVWSSSGMTIADGSGADESGDSIGSIFAAERNRADWGMPYATRRERAATLIFAGHGCCLAILRCE